MRVLARLILSVLLLLLCRPPPASACSMVEDANRDSLYDMVARADLVILARAEGFWPFRPDLIAALNTPLVDFKPLEVLKGTAGGIVPVYGRLEDAWLTQSYVCPVPAYVRGGTYLLFLNKGGDRFMASFTARSYDRQLYQLHPNIDTPLPLVRLFARMQQQGDLDQQWQVLEAALVPRLRPDAGEEERLEARHILDHLRSISPQHPAARLLTLYDGAADMVPRWGLRTWDFPEDNWDRRPWPELLASPDILLNGNGDPNGMLAGWRRQELLHALSMPGHQAAEPFFRRLMADNPDGLAAGPAAVFLAWHGKRGEALDIVERHYPALRQDRSVTSVTMDDLADAIRASQPAWRDDPALAGRWPALAHRLMADVAYGDLLDP